MVVYQIKTFSDIYNAVARRTKVTTSDTNTLITIKEIINSVYDQILKEQKWNFKTETRQLVVKGKYNTGTVSVVNGSRTLVFNGATLDDNWLYRYIYIIGEAEHYQIISVDTSTSTVYLSTNYLGTTNATASYTVYQPVVGLFPDLDKIEDVYQASELKKLQALSKREMDELHATYPTDEGKARYYTACGQKYYEGVVLGEMILGYDFLGNPDSYAIKLFPKIADEDYVLNITYSKKVDKMENDEDEPIIPLESRIILLYGALAAFYAQQNNESQFQYWNGLFLQEVKKLESDIDDVSEFPQLKATNKWRKNRRIMATSIDWGSFFDKY